MSLLQELQACAILTDTPMNIFHDYLDYDRLPSKKTIRYLIDTHNHLKKADRPLAYRQIRAFLEQIFGFSNRLVWMTPTEMGPKTRQFYEEKYAIYSSIEDIKHIYLHATRREPLLRSKKLSRAQMLHTITVFMILQHVAMIIDGFIPLDSRR